MIKNIIIPESVGTRLKNVSKSEEVKSSDSQAVSLLAGFSLRLPAARKSVQTVCISRERIRRDNDGRRDQRISSSTAERSL